MHQLIAAYIYMRYYQRHEEFKTSKFKMAFLKCYTIMTEYYCALFLDRNRAHPADADFTLALRIFQVLSIQKNMKEGLSCLTQPQIDQITGSVDQATTQYYRSVPTFFQKHPRLKDYLPEPKTQSCHISCGPSDYRPGGKCDIHGCYEHQE